MAPGTIAQLEREGLDWDTISDIAENLTPEDKKQCWAVRKDAHEALVPEARWDTEYRLLLAEHAALRAERDALQARIDEALVMIEDSFPTPAGPPEGIASFYQLRLRDVALILEGDNDE